MTIKERLVRGVERAFACVFPCSFFPRRELEMPPDAQNAYLSCY